MLKQYFAKQKSKKVNITVAEKEIVIEVLGVDRGSDDATKKKHTVNWQKYHRIFHEPGRQEEGR